MILFLILNYFKKVLPNINIITVPKTIKKADYVDATGAILVDDYTQNLDYWKEKGGIPVKFSSLRKENAHPVITDLLELIGLFIFIFIFNFKFFER